jgi:hypothetical protein
LKKNLDSDVWVNGIIVSAEGIFAGATPVVVYGQVAGIAEIKNQTCLQSLKIRMTIEFFFTIENAE